MTESKPVIPVPTPGAIAEPPAQTPAQAAAANPTPVAAPPEKADAAAAQPAARRVKNASRPVKGRQMVPPGQLSANIQRRSQSKGVVREYVFWVGVYPQCPTESINLAGVCFPKVNERLEPDPKRTGRKRRIPQIGALVRLRFDKIAAMRDKISRTVIRFQNSPGHHEEPGTGDNIGDAAQRPSKGRLITIPSDNEITERKKNGYTVKHYVPDIERDRDAANYMFCILCDDQGRPQRGNHYPDPLSETGLAWPDEDTAALESFLK